MPSNQSRTASVATGFLTSTAQYGLQIVLQAFLAPIILRYAGRDTLGAYAAIYQGLSYLALVDFGYAQPLERFLAQAHNKDDGGAHFRLIFSTFRSFLLLSNVVFAALVVIYASQVAVLFGLSGPVLRQAKSGLYLLSLWAILRTPFSAYNCALISVQHMAYVNTAMGILAGTRLVVSLILVSRGFGLLGLILAALAVDVVGNFSYRWLFLQRFPERRPQWGIKDRKLLREIASFGSHTALLQLATMLTFNSGNLFIGYFFGAAAVSVYYTTQMPCLFAYNFVFRLSDNVGPGLNELWAKRKIEKIRAVYCRLMRCSLLAGFALSTGLLLFNKLLVASWVGLSQYGGLTATAALAMLVLIFVVDHVNTVFAIVIGEVKIMTKMTLAQAALIGVLATVLGHWLGISGVILAAPLALMPRLIALTNRIAQVLGIHWSEINTIAFDSVRILVIPVFLSGLLLFVLRGALEPVQLFSGIAAFVVGLMSSLILSPATRDELRSFGLIIRAAVTRARPVSA